MQHFFTMLGPSLNVGLRYYKGNGNKDWNETLCAVLESAIVRLFT